MSYKKQSIWVNPLDDTRVAITRSLLNEIYQQIEDRNLSYKIYQLLAEGENEEFECPSCDRTFTVDELYEKS